MQSNALVGCEAPSRSPLEQDYALLQQRSKTMCGKSKNDVSFEAEERVARSGRTCRTQRRDCRQIFSPRQTMIGA
ncbi:MAG: hypothetical protein HUK03_00415 [Bacteroidaceae bacterium]|nr:hypothetical protein [Bacteroidaceae bacterium]